MEAVRAAANFARRSPTLPDRAPRGPRFGMSGRAPRMSGAQFVPAAAPPRAGPPNAPALAKWSARRAMLARRGYGDSATLRMIAAATSKSFTDWVFSMSVHSSSE